MGATFVLNAAHQIICIRKQHTNHMEDDIKRILQDKPGADPEGGAHLARDPAIIGKNMIFWRKSVIFHTKYPQNFRVSLRSAQFF